MSTGNIKLWWTVPKQPDSFNIYHALEPFEKTRLPPPAATGLAATDRDFLHLDKEHQYDHYYRIASVKNGRLYVSRGIRVRANEEIIPIGCEGATSSVFIPYIEGEWGLEIDGNGVEDAYAYQSREYWGEYNIESVGMYSDSLVLNNLDNEHRRIRLFPLNEDIQIVIPSGEENPSSEVNPTLAIDENGEVTFCLAPYVSQESCLALPPFSLELDQIHVKLDEDFTYYFYYEDLTNVLREVEVRTNQILDGVYVSVAQLESAISFRGFNSGLITDAYQYAEECETYVYTGNYGVIQNDTLWGNSDSVGDIYIEIGGEREYLAGSSRTFSHNGNYAALNSIMRPYYEGVVAFLTSKGIDATYNSSGGVYGEGRIDVIFTEHQADTVVIGSYEGRPLSFKRGSSRLNAVCALYKSFSELENGSGTLIIQPHDYGTQQKSEYKILGTHIPSDPSKKNIMRELGLTSDVSLASCHVAPSNPE